MTDQLDIAIRNGTVVRATDRAMLDVAVKDGRIVNVGRSVAAARLDIDAANRRVLAGASDSHCHVAQESSAGLMTADDSYAVTLAAACGGTTTIPSSRSIAVRRCVSLTSVTAGPATRPSWTTQSTCSPQVPANGRLRRSAVVERRRVPVVQDIHHL